MTEELKKADNQIDINKQRINQIDSQIDSNKNKMRVLSEMEDGFSSLSMNIEKYTNLRRHMWKLVRNGSAHTINVFTEGI